MKIFLTMMAAAAAMFAFTPTNADAGGCRSKIHSRCGSCGGNVYSYYQAVGYCSGRPVYSWVPRYHSNCGRGHSGHSHHGSSYGSRGGVSVHFGTVRSPSYYNRGYSSGYRSGYTSRSYGGYGSRNYRSGTCR